MPIRNLVDRLGDVGQRLKQLDWDTWDKERNRFAEAIRQLDHELREQYGYALTGLRIATLSRTFHLAIGSDPVPTEIAQMEQLLRTHGVEPDTVRRMIDERVTAIVT